MYYTEFTYVALAVKHYPSAWTIGSMFTRETLAKDSSYALL